MRRRLLLKSAIGFAGVCALLIGWIAGARSLSLLFDRMHTVRMESRPIAELGLEDADAGMWRIDHLPMNTAGPDNHRFPMETKIDPERQFVVQTPGHAIALGRVGESQILKPEPGDRVRLQIDRSMLSWPTPFELNFISGKSPSWKRHLYYRLIWEKPDGGRLEMVWRYEQWFYDDWASGFMTHEGSTGLIRVDIRP